MATGNTKASLALRRPLGAGNTQGFKHNNGNGHVIEKPSQINSGNPDTFRTAFALTSLVNSRQRERHET
jgi:hypothetical protein